MSKECAENVGLPKLSVAEAQRIVIAAFAAAARGPVQRSPDWFLAMLNTIGGNEIAAALGCNHYSSFDEVAMSKIAQRAFEGGEACDWGTILEDVIALVAARDASVGGAPIQGDSICILRYPRHRYSPDGYAVVRVAWEAGVARVVLRGEETRRGAKNREYTAAGAPIFQLVALLEFKCPLSRKLPVTPAVPPQYVPQVLSGLCVSPVASLGLFVDSVFRKCALRDLVHSSDYDLEYHWKDKDGEPRWPLAMGLVGVYAPATNQDLHLYARRVGARLSRVFEDAFDEAAARIDDLIASRLSGRAGALLCYPPVDFGGASRGDFAGFLGIAAKSRRAQAVMPEGLSAAEGAAWAAETAVDFILDTRPGEVFFGLFPWKLVEMNYVPVLRDPDYESVILGVTREVFDLVDAARAHETPEAELRRLLAARQKEQRGAGAADSDADSGPAEEIVLDDAAAAFFA